MNEIKITVLLPTYNRKEKLLMTLKALSVQCNDRFEILISDNCSGYSIENEVLPELPIEFVNRVTVYHQRFNIGGVHNIIGSLSLCNTEYGWLLGDDDHVQPEAIENIYQVIELYPDVNAFWFSIDKKIKKDVLFTNMDQLQEFLVSLNNRGDFIFCSNKVYKVAAIALYMDLTYRFTYTRIPQCLPLIEMLKRGDVVGIIGGKVLAEHGGFDNGEITWDVNKTVSGLRTLMDYPTGLVWHKHCQFVKSVMFIPSFVLKGYLKTSVIPWNYKNYLKNIYTSCYKYCYPWYKRIVIKFVFWIASNPAGWKLFKKIF